MVRPAGRRKIRKRKAQAENSRMKLTVITGIMFLAVFLGFLTARFVIGPVIGYNADECEIRLADDNGEDSGETNQEQEQEVSTASEKGYALQFGAFSTEDAAEEMSKQLGTKGVETEIVRAGDIYKVIGRISGDREEALSALEEIKNKEITDVFIASFQ
jgi:hypothetical protein